jgi:hypothetical protein
MSRVVPLALLIALGCAKYPGWEYVRVEPIPPSTECVYKVQESCPSRAPEGCLNWYKKRATRFQANTIVVTGDYLAEYFACPLPATRKAPSSATPL